MSSAHEKCTCSHHGHAPEAPLAHSHGHGHNHDHEQEPCCNNAASPVLSGASDALARYRIPAMDCPMEEDLIRKKLGGLSGIVSLEFNLMGRLLTVRHALPSTEPIEAALKSIDMIPELVPPSGSARSLFFVAEMDCPAEENLIRSKLGGVTEISELEFDLMRRILTVRHAPDALPAISRALSSLDLGARLMEEEEKPPSPIAGSKTPWAKLALAGLFAALSEALDLMNEWGVAPDIGSSAVIAYLPAALAVVAILLSGLATYKKGWIAVRNLNLNINALMSVAVTGAVIIGQYPEAAMVMVLFSLSEAIEAKALDRARNAIRDLLALAPETAVVLQPDGSWKETDIRETPIGARIRVRPGEKVALDGAIIQGSSSINQAPITGESMPVEKTIGDVVYAGTINESGSFEFETTALSTNSTLARIIHAVEEAQGSRAPIQRFVDQFARYYTPAVFLLALFAAVLPPLFMSGSWGESIYVALVLLVIGCPCALVISTPVSIVSGMAAAARRGVLIKGGAFLEQGRLLKWLALDKTGTITQGKPRQTDFEALGGANKDEVIALAAGIAARSDHPVSKAIAENATKNGVVLPEIDDFAAIPGQGVQGAVNGRIYYLGNHRMAEQIGKCSADLEGRIFALEKQGKSVVALIGDAGPLGLFAVADTVKSGSAEAIGALKKLGVKTIMLTGDNEHTAQAIAAEVGVDEFKANLLPEDKLRIIERLKEDGKVGMVGDGINDAPALAMADVGFAMAGQGTDTAIETADVALMDDDLRKIPRFISLSGSTHAILVQNISLALGVKALFFALAFLGQATMWMAVFADVGASLLVVANGLRIIRK